MSDKSNFRYLKKFRKETVEPRPASLIETFRAIGYNLASALADIVDNSISAECKYVHINFFWKKEDTYITILDDGKGMSEEELVEALRPGTHNPLGDRKSEDLGRFGLGLKTASFSQCRVLSIISKNAGNPKVHLRAWHLDYVEHYNIWEIIEYISMPELKDLLKNKSKGTLVVWENLDRIIYDQNGHLITQRKFLEAVREIEHHLSMVFHRFLESGKIKLFINEQPVSAWDPFLRKERATQSFPTETFMQGKICITGYVLPHPSKTTAEVWNAAAGTEGWNASQGFYIYRKDRMLLAGDWLGLLKKQEFTRLARIMIDIDAELDFAWQLDIRKSRAIPPKMFQDDLKRYALEITKSAIDVYKHRGKQKQRKAGRSHFEFAWMTVEENGREYYRVNRNHPLVRSMAEKMGTKKSDLEKLLKLLEITLPVPAIVLSESQHADKPAESGTPSNDSEVAELMKATYKQLLQDKHTRSKALEELYFIDPFSNYPHLIESLSK
ncbi:hypothetical protein A3860_29855 [Niastella vici]|uniref:ATP-binding protein n=1 Tax=Niastella vici TaxID=1703345 RepID=A0A1V9FU79_9BACT|nr:ATP-binding protein [Niastella vici]OQP61903.1 hypothetical protein A3860_29855 [Niastella vici]